MATAATSHNRYKPGTLGGDILLARLSADNPVVGANTLDRLAYRILPYWKLHARVRRALRDRPREERLSPQELKRGLLGPVARSPSPRAASRRRCDSGTIGLWATGGARCASSLAICRTTCSRDG